MIMDEFSYKIQAYDFLIKFMVFEINGKKAKPKEFIKNPYGNDKNNENNFIEWDDSQIIPFKKNKKVIRKYGLSKDQYNSIITSMRKEMWWFK